MHRAVQNFTLHTDASGVGWGATLASLTSGTLLSFSGIWSSREVQQHSNVKELLAVDYALRRAQLSNSLVQIYSDNTSVVAVLNRQGSICSWSLQRIAFSLFRFLQATNLEVRAAHIPGILNKGADILSRPNQIFATEWALNKSVFRWICASLHFSPAIDAFATAANAQLPAYFSPVPDEGAAGLDAFNQSWDGWALYLFPPFVLLPQVIQKLQASKSTTALLVYPEQPRRPWYPGLMQIPHSSPIPLPVRRTLLSQPHNAATHPRLAVLNLHAATFNVG
jgi:hypothetical protein